MKLSKYIYITDSYDGNFKLLYNSKNGYFIKYNISDFGNLNSFLEVDDVREFLSSKDFFCSENEEKNLIDSHERTLKSEDRMMIVLKISKNCNFRCTYCYENFKNENLTESNQDIIINFIKNKLLDGKIKYLQISWFGGEPLLNMSCIKRMGIKLIEICNKLGVKYSSSIVTNGYLLNKRNIRELCEVGIDTFQVTIDGDEEIHDKQRVLINGRGTFETIFKNLCYLKTIEGQFNVVLRTNISKSMLGKMERYVNKMRIFFDDDRFVAMFHPVVDFESMEHEVTDVEVMKEIKYAICNGFVFAPVTAYLDSDASFCYGMKENHYVIDTNLEVSKCTVVNEPYSIIGRIDNSGNLIENTYIKLWKGARISSKCKNCDFYASCAGGACPMYYLKRGEARCMKYKSLEKKFEILKIADMQKAYDACIHL